MRWFTIPYPSTNGMHYAPNIDNPYFFQEVMGNIVLIIITKKYSNNLIIAYFESQISKIFRYKKYLEHNFVFEHDTFVYT